MAEQAKMSEIGRPVQFASHHEKAWFFVIRAALGMNPRFALARATVFRSRFFRLLAENRNCFIAGAPCAKGSGGYDG